jgi:hypothetical protein
MIDARRFGAMMLAALLAIGPACADSYTNPDGSVSPGIVMEDGGGNKNDATHPLYTAPSTSAPPATQAPVAPGAASATKSTLLGCQFNSSPPTFSNGQQGAVQCDSLGRWLVDVGVMALPTGASTASNQTAIQAPVAPATASATKAALVACQYNAALETFVGGQQGTIQCDAFGRLIVATPDVRATGQTINSATSNVALTVPLDLGQSVVGFAVSGLTASGGTLAVEASNDGGTTWSAINGVTPATGAQFTTLTVDQQFRVNAAGHTNVRLRVSSTGSGTVTVGYTVSRGAPLLALSSPLPAGTNKIGGVTIADGDAATLGSKADAKSTATDTTAITIMSVLKQISASVQSMATSLGGSLGLGAGSNIIGKVGIDQTTPGTTDLVTPRLTRPILLTGSFVPGTSYSAGNNIGGLQTLATGLPSGTKVIIKSTRWMITAGTTSAIGAISAVFFNASPTTTFTDGSAITINAADAANYAGFTSGATIITPFAGAGVSDLAMVTNNTTTVDASGNLYLALQASATITLVTPSHFTYAIEVDY